MPQPIRTTLISVKSQSSRQFRVPLLCAEWSHALFPRPLPVSVRRRSPSCQGHQQAQGSGWLTFARFTFGSFVKDDSQGQELVHCAFVLDGCTRGKSDAGTGGRCSTFVLLLLPPLWLFLFVQVEDGLFVDGDATRGWCISGLVSVER